MPPQPAIFQSVTTALSDVWSAMKAMKVEFTLCFAALLASALLSKPYLPKASPPPGSFTTLAFGVASALVIGAVIAPLAVLIHRRIILGEDCGLEALPALRSRIVEFFIATVALQFAFVIATVAMAVVAVGFGRVGGVLSIIGFAALLYVTLRFFLLFPAIAIDGPFKDPAGAFQRSKGLIWRRFAAAALLYIAVTLLQKAAVLLGKAVSLEVAEVLATVGTALGDLVLTAAFVAIASRFYMWRRDADGARSPDAEGPAAVQLRRGETASSC